MSTEQTLPDQARVQIPANCSDADLERLLDRLAVEVVAMRGDGAMLHAMYRWLEAQIEQRREYRELFSAARKRVKRLHDRTTARS